VLTAADALGNHTLAFIAARLNRRLKRLAEGAQVAISVLFESEGMEAAPGRLGFQSCLSTVLIQRNSGIFIG